MEKSTYSSYDEDNSCNMSVETMEDDSSSENNFSQKPSKTQLKKEMHTLQQLGEQLTYLSDTQLKELNLPEQLFEAIMETKRITKFGARHRQLQFIGKIMRKIDAFDIETISNAVTTNTPSNQTALLHLTERWRERLLNDRNALTEFAREYSTADIQQIRLLIRNILKAQEINKPAKDYRVLFQILQKAIIEMEK